jgi:hypothetical protein
VLNYAANTYGGVEVRLHAFLISALDGGEPSASHPGRFTPGKKVTLPTETEAGGDPDMDRAPVQEKNICLGLE